MTGETQGRQAPALLHDAHALVCMFRAPVLAMHVKGDNYVAG